MTGNGTLYCIENIRIWLTLYKVQDYGHRGLVLYGNRIRENSHCIKNLEQSDWAIV
jgi:hypothetical protein